MDGTTVGNYEYDAYGNVLSSTNDIYNPYGYSGEYFDEETGYYYLKARYYDPSIGSFIQKDTYSGEISSPASLNPYGYCQANPIYYSDPSGHAVETALDVAGLVADAYDFYKKPSLINGAFLLWSVASVVVPVLPGSYVGKVVKGISKFDDVADTYKVIKRTKTVVDTVDTTIDTVNTIKKTASTIDKITDLGKTATKYVDDFLEAGAKKTAKESAEKEYKQLVKKTQETASKFIQEISKKHKKVDASVILNDLPSNQGFDTFKDFKKTFGAAGDGREWHHVVEQSQIEKSGFSPQSVHNTSNMISIDKSTHSKITGYYNTKSFKFTEGLSVRDWLSTKNYEYQFNFGIEKLREFGVLR